MIARIEPDYERAMLVSAVQNMNWLLQIVRARPKSFFLACAIAGFGVSRLPFLYEPNGNMAIGAFLGTWILLGLVVGMLAPERPWRWAVAMVIAAPLVNVTRALLGRSDANITIGRGS